MFSGRAVFQRFADIVSGAERDIRLAEAALIVASEFRKGVSVPEYLNWIDSAARDFPAGPQIDDVPKFFRETLGFVGDADEYYDPRNSLLDQVIERRKGIPITLSLLLIELGSVKDWQFQGIGFPGHFLVREPHTQVYIDPFHGSELLDKSAAQRRVLSMMGQSNWKPSWERPNTPRQILFRLLTNLKLVLLDLQEYSQAAAVQEKLVVLAPGRPQEYRDLGVVAASAGDWAMAKKFLTDYLVMRPDAKDAELVRAQLQHLSDQLARRN